MNLEDTVFIIKPHEKKSASYHLALEEALYLKALDQLKRSGTFDPIIRLYSFSKPAVILGYRQKISEIDLTYCSEHGVEVTMRKTGGGSVYLGAGDVQYSLILPSKYSKNLLRNINEKIVIALQDIGFSPQLVNENNHSVIRMQKKSFVFDAQRRSIIYLGNITNPKFALLHHGTILVDNEDYEHMPRALKASSQHIYELNTGNIWLRNKYEIAEYKLIQSLHKNLPFGLMIIKKEYTSEELNLAKELYDEFYSKPTMFSDGNKKYGICYRPTFAAPSTLYNMEKYVEKEEITYARTQFS